MERTAGTVLVGVVDGNPRAGVWVNESLGLSKGYRVSVEGVEMTPEDAKKLVALSGTKQAASKTFIVLDDVADDPTARAAAEAAAAAAAEAKAAAAAKAQADKVAAENKAAMTSAPATSERDQRRNA